MALGEIFEILMKEYLGSEEIITRFVTAYGTSGHVNIPKKFVGRRVKILIFPEEEEKKK